MNWKRIKRLLFFALVLIAINYSLSHFFRKEMEGRVVNQLDEAFYKENTPINYLILGNSHAFGIRPQPSDSSVVFAAYGENIVQTYYRLKYVTDLKERKFKNIILPFDFQYLSNSEIPNLNIDFWVKYIDFYEYSQISKKYSENLFKYLKGNFFPYSGQTMAVWEAINLKDQAIEGQSQKLIKDNSTTCPKQIIDSIAEIYFFKVLDICKANNIGVVLLKYPYRRDYYNDLQKCFKETDYFNEIEPKIKLRAQKILILDHSKDFIDEPAKFDDGHHLSSLGNVRTIFTKSIFDTLQKKPFLR